MFFLSQSSVADPDLELRRGGGGGEEGAEEGEESSSVFLALRLFFWDFFFFTQIGRGPSAPPLDLSLQLSLTPSNDSGRRKLLFTKTSQSEMNFLCFNLHLFSLQNGIATQIICLHKR